MMRKAVEDQTRTSDLYYRDSGTAPLSLYFDRNEASKAEVNLLSIQWSVWCCNSSVLINKFVVLRAIVTLGVECSCGTFLAHNHFEDLPLLNHHDRKSRLRKPHSRKIL